MNFILGILILSTLHQKDNNVAPYYFFQTATCYSASYTIINTWEFDLKSSEYFTLTKTIIDSRDALRTRSLEKIKNKPSKGGMIFGTWKVDGDTITLYPSFSSDIPIQILPKEVSFRVTDKSVHKTTSDKGENGFPDVMHNSSTMVKLN